MSTKIYNAYKFNGSMDELLIHLKQFRSKWYESKVEDIFNQMNMFDKKYNGWGWDEIRSTIESQTKKNYNTWGDFFDIKASVMIFPHKKSLYVIPYITGRNVPEFIDDRFEDFHYQDQTDTYFDDDFDDGKITKEERVKLQRNWRKRKKVWKEIFPGNETPVEVGLSYNFNTLDDSYNIARDVYIKREDIK